jgi:hypothetical protein
MSIIKESLTPTEAADLVANVRPRPTADGDDPGYCCMQCGSNDFEVVKEGYRRVTYQESLECHCGECSRAAEETRTDVHRFVIVHELDRAHRLGEVVDEFDKDIEEGDRVTEIHCHECGHDSEPSDWMAEAPEVEMSDEDDFEFSVRCSRCRHEIEFGWSHPGRGGRFWPCEAADFNPWKSWPEPRFRADWVRRGWIPPDRLTPEDAE